MAKYALSKIYGWLAAQVEVKNGNDKEKYKISVVTRKKSSLNCPLHLAEQLKY